MAKRQLNIAGTEPETNHEIEDAASIYRGHMLDRMENTKLEKGAKEALIAVVHKQVETGKLKLPPNAKDGEVVTVYTFHSDEGDMEVKYGVKEQVRVRKVKDGDDDVEELMD